MQYRTLAGFAGIAPLLALVTGCATSQSAVHDPGQHIAAIPSPTNSLQARAQVAYAAGYRMGGNLLSLGWASVPEGMDATARTECSNAISNADVSKSYAAYEDQHTAWESGCKDALEAKVANEAAAPIITPPPYSGDDLLDTVPAVDCGSPRNTLDFGGNFTCRFTGLHNSDDAPHAYRITLEFSPRVAGPTNVRRTVTVPMIPAGATGSSDPFPAPPATSVGTGALAQGVQWDIDSEDVKVLPPAGN
ncbi:hypothetical protein [Streptomyces sp. NPDC046197]|uniref:hypothetical protein n=1 Tax=Streptomyces sp. NPDC046197 TaxID=3154337 RepID=UPI0033C43C32